MALLLADEDDCEGHTFRYYLKRLRVAMGQRKGLAVIGLVVFATLCICFGVIGAASTALRNRKLLPHESCGVGANHTEQNLVGYQAALDDAPWLALLRLRLRDGRDIFSCTGVLINDYYVLTAAHCLASVNIPNDAYIDIVRLGEYNMDTNEDCIDGQCSPIAQDIEVEERIMHPYYNPKNPEPHNDVGLLRLRSKAKINAYVKPICLPSANVNIEEGKKLIFAGWPRIHKTGKDQKPEKVKIALSVANFEQCDLLYQAEKMGFTLKESQQMCVGGNEGRNEYCHWGTGGPAMSLESVGNEMRWFVAGISSYGPPDCGKIGDNHPDIFTKVPTYIDWILDNLRR